jgi:hypothetical protein
MENAWMPKAAGILDIVAGSLGILFSLVMGLWFAFFYYYTSFPSGPGSEFNDFPMRFMMLLMIPWAIFMLVAGILAIAGGIYALKRKKWGLALAGSVGAVFSQLALGVVAVIFTVMGKSEFE